MTTQIQSISSIEGLMPHGMCLHWQPNLLSMHVISDALIALSYFSIPFALIYFVIKRQDLSFRWLFVLFGLFILACGTTHLVKIWTIWHPDYFFEGLAKAATAVVSLLTAVMLWPFIPIALKLPSPSALAQANALLQEEVLEKQRYENEIRLLNRELERKVEERTQSLHATNRQLKQEVAERQQAERALRESDEQLKAIVDSAADGIIIINQTGTIESVNASVEAIFGYSKEALIGQDVARLIPTPDNDRHADYLTKYLQTGVKKMIGIRRETQGLHKDGHEFPMEISVTEFQRNGRLFFTAIIRDITERKQAEETLRQSQTRNQILGDLVQKSSQPLASVYPDGRLGMVNPAFEALTGYSEQELRAISLATDLTPPEWREAERAALTVLEQTGEPVRYQKEYLRKDGTRIPVELLVHQAVDAEGKPLQYYGFITDITERKKEEQALREADRRKDEFLATLAHELRNPLAPIQNGLHILEMAKGDKETFERIRAMMVRQVVHLVRLVDDLMEVSRINRGKIKLHKERIELTDVLQNAVESCRPIIDAAQHQLKIILPAEPILLEGDEVRLTQVFVNLLNNAAKYTKDGGRIWLSARREGTDALVSVRDNGMGISADMLPNVFNPFTQAGPTADHRAQGGLGIGLTLVQKLVKLHGGSVEVNSDGLDKGAEFLVRLPLAEEKPHLDFHVHDESQPVIVTPHRILVVDDNHDVADSLAMMLELLGAEVVVAHNGPAALDMVQTFKPAVVFLDIGMPGMDGHEVAARVRQLPEGRNITLIALTGWGQAEDRRRSREAGFDYHLVKPATPNDLKQLLANIAAHEKTV